MRWQYACKYQSRKIKIRGIQLASTPGILFSIHETPFAKCECPQERCCVSIGSLFWGARIHTEVKYQCGCATRRCHLTHSVSARRSAKTEQWIYPELELS